MKVLRTCASAIGIALLSAHAFAARTPAQECAIEKRMLDVESVRNSGGNWKAVKVAGGQPIAAGANEMQVLALAFTSGCFVEPDIAAARRMLEVWANNHHDIGKRAAASHCTLATWYRYGIGGNKDEAAAVRWEKRFEVESHGHTCNPHWLKPPGDPTDPWNLRRQGSR
jgi:hypothetical protein